MRLATSLGLSDGIPVSGGVTPFVNTKSLDFDGVDDYVDCGEFTAVDGTSAMTLSAWVKAPTGAQSDSYAIVLYKAPSNYFGIYQNNLANQLTFRLVTSGGTVTINGSVGFFDGDWHHIAGTYDGANMYFYEDGVQISTAAQTGTITGSTDDLYIGSQSGTSNFIAGQIDEVSVWSTGLSSGDVSALWNSGTPNNLNTALATTPVAWWRMGDGDTYPTLTDNSGSNNGTMTNMVAGDIVEDTP